MNGKTGLVPHSQNPKIEAIKNPSTIQVVKNPPKIQALKNPPKIGEWQNCLGTPTPVLLYPRELHDLHNDYPVAPEKAEVSKICYRGIAKRLLKNIRFQSVK